MDDAQRLKRIQAARERQLAALPSVYGVSEEQVEELKAVRLNGQLRDAYEVFEEEKRAEIFEEAARYNTSEANASDSSLSEENPPKRRGRPKKSESSNGEQ